MTRSAGLLTLLIAVIGFALRVPIVHSRGIGGNEATTLLTIAGHAEPTYPSGARPVRELESQLYNGAASLSTITHELRASDGHPPTYYWLLSTWTRVFGSSLFSARQLSNLFGALFVVVAGILFAPSMSLLRLALFELVVTFSSVVAFYSTEARSYMFCLLVGICLIALARWTEKRSRPRDFFLLGCATGLAVFTHYLLVIVALAIGVWLFTCLRRGDLRGLLQKALLFALPNTVLTAVSFDFYRAQNVHDSNRLGYHGFVADLGSYGRFALRTFINQTDSLSVAVAALLLVFTVIVLFRAAPRERKDRRLGVLLALATIGALLFIDAALDRFMWSYRYFSYVAPSLIFLLGLALSRREQKIVPTILLLIALGGEMRAYNWRAAPVARADYTKSPFVDARRAIYNTPTEHAIVLIEETPEGRGWHAGLVAELAAYGDVQTRVMKVSTVTPSLVQSDDEISKFATVWYLVTDDLSPGVPAKFEAQLPALKDFHLVSKNEWGFELKKNSAP